MKISSKILTTFLLLVLYLGLIPAADATDFSDAFRRSILIKKYSGNPRAQYTSWVRANMIKKGVPAEQVNTKVNEFAQLYDSRAETVTTGRLPKEGGTDKLLWESAKWALQTLANTLSGGTSGDLGPLTDLGESAAESYAARDVINDLSESFTDARINSVTQVEKHTDLILDAYDSAPIEYKDILRVGIALDIGVDMEASEDALVATNADLAAYFQSRTNGGSLSEIMALMESYPGDLADFKDQILDAIEGETSVINQEIQDQTTQLGEALGELEADILNSAEILGGEIGKNHALLTRLVNDANEQRLAAEERAADLAKQADRSAYFQLGITLLREIDPKLANDVSVVVSTTIKVQNAIQGFSKLKKLGDIGTAAATLDLVDGAMAIVGLLGESNGQVSPEQMIMEQIQQLQMQIAEMRQEMHERFDIVDQKLDAIYDAINRGFELVLANQATIVDGVIRNSQIGLNTQSLILSESQRIVDTVLDFELRECIEWKERLNSEIPDLKFGPCAIDLGGYAIEGIKRDQLSYNSGLVGSELANLLNSDERITNQLYRTFLATTGQFPDSDVMVSPEQWYVASSWYRDFLLDWPSQSQTQLADLRFDEMIQIGQEIIAFRNSLLETFKNYDGEPEETPIGEYINAGEALVKDIEAMQNTATDKYFLDNQITPLLNIQQPLTSLSWGGSFGQPIQPNTSLPDTHEPTLSQSAAEKLIHHAPERLKLAEQLGLGKFVIHRKYIDTSIHTHSCGFLGSSTFYIADYDVWRIDVEFVPNQNIELSTIPIGKLDFIYPDATSGEIRLGCGGFVSAGPKFCTSSSCISSRVANQNGSFTKYSVNDSVIAAEWEHHRELIAPEMLSIMESAAAKSIDEFTIGQNAYISALIRFAFSDVVEASDPLFGLGSGQAGIPLIGDLAALANKGSYDEIWAIDDFVQSEVNALKSYFTGDEIKHWVDVVSAQIPMEDAINRLIAAQSVVENYDATDPSNGPVNLSGTVQGTDGTDICAMVLASGQFMFSCNPNGIMSLINLPREQDGTVKRQIYADGYFPKIDILTGTTDDTVVMERSGTCPNYNTSYKTTIAPGSAGKWIDISGSVGVGENGVPVCAMVLANGQHMFSCDGTGSYALNIPLDSNGQFKLQVYADGYAPTIQVFDEFKAANNVRMARAAECQ